MEKGPSETTYSEGFTLGLSKLSEPDVTTDIVHCNTALYAQPDAINSNFSLVGTQDKPTVMASQQRQRIEAKQHEQVEVKQKKMEKDRSSYLFPMEEGTTAETHVEEGFSPSQSVDNMDAEKFSKEEGASAQGGQSEDHAAMLESEEVEESSEIQTSVKDKTKLD